MTRFLLSMLLALPLAITAGCDPSNPDDDTSDDDDTGTHVPTLTLVVNVETPVTVDKCKVTRDVQAYVTDPNNGCSGTSEAFDEYDEYDAEVEVEAENKVFSSYVVVVDWTADNVSAHVEVDGGLVIDALEPMIETAENGDITVTANIQWTEYAAWCYAPEGRYEDEATGLDFETVTWINMGQCRMENACAGDDVAVNIDTFSHETDGGLLCEGTINENLSQIEAYWQNSEDEYNLLFIRQ